MLQLVGMLDSPFVRRVAVSLLLLEVPFEHRSISVFRGFDDFRRINPVVKAPSLVCDDDEVLMDSSLILEHVEALAHPRSLVPADAKARQRDLRLTGLALAACEKSGQIIYERGLRPPEKQHAPWVDRVGGQLLAAYAELEQALGVQAPGTTSRAGIAVAVAWRFTQSTLPERVSPADHPRLAAFSAAAEGLPAFQAAPCDESAVVQKR